MESDTLLSSRQRSRVASTASALFACSLGFVAYSLAVILFVGSPLGRDLFSSTVSPPLPTASPTPAPTLFVPALDEAFVAASLRRRRCPVAICSAPACVVQNRSDTCHERLRRRVVREHRCESSLVCMRVVDASMRDCRVGVCRERHCEVDDFSEPFSCECFCATN